MTDLEPERLAVLRALELLDTAAEPEYDAIVHGARQLLGCKSAFISLIDADRQWIKARCNLDVSETARDISFCTHAIAQRRTLVVPDARTDERFADNPLVVGPPFIRFYAGVPLYARAHADSTRLPVGTLCVIDDAPHRPTADAIDMLERMASVVEALFDARRVSRDSLAMALERHDTLMACERVRRQLAQAERMANIGSWRLDLLSEQVAWSDQTYVIHGLTPGASVDLSQALTFFPPADRARIAAALATCTEQGRGYDLELDFVDAGGMGRRLRAIGEPELRDGRPVAIIGVVQDMTDRHRLEQNLRELAHTDELTGLASRRAFNELLDAASAQAAASGEPLAVALLDLDNFKLVNDRLGHAAGDAVLRHEAATLRDAAFLGDHLAARLGGDEFVLLLRGDAAGAALESTIARLLADMRRTIEVPGGTASVSATIGAARFGRDQADRSTLLKAADRALYRAKQAARGTGAIDGSGWAIAAIARGPLASAA